MHKIFTIIKREFKEAVLKKSFIIMTIIIPFLMVALTIVPSLLAGLDTEEPQVIAIYDESGLIKNAGVNLISDTLENGAPRFVFNMIDGALDKADILTRQKQHVNNQFIDGFLIVPVNVMEGEEIIYYARNVSNFDVNRKVSAAVSEVVVNQRLKNSGIDNNLINDLTQRVPLKTIKISAEGQESERGFETEFFSTFIFIFILYMTLIMYGFVLMRSIIEEKTSRIIEVLLSSVNPFQLMAGKIIGSGSVGLTQYIIWGIFGLALFFFGPALFSVAPSSFSLSPKILFYFALFYLLGYFFYASLYTGVGALTNTDQEAQQLAMPITLMLIVPIVMLAFMVKNPDSSAVQVMSYIPFFSPMMMFARINISSPSLLEIWSSVLILLASIIISIWISSKVFKVGILMYGKRPTLPEILKWFRS